MANTIAKHRHYLFMQRPSRGIARCAKWNAHCTAESAAQPQTNPLTLAELLEHADQDGADRMVHRLHYISRCSIEHNIRPWLRSGIHVHVHHIWLQDASLRRTGAVYLCITGLSRSQSAPKNLERRQAAASRKSGLPLEACLAVLGKADHSTPLQYTRNCSCVGVA